MHLEHSRLQQCEPLILLADCRGIEMAMAGLARIAARFVAERAPPEALKVRGQMRRRWQGRCGDHIPFHREGK